MTTADVSSADAIRSDGGLVQIRNVGQDDVDQLRELYVGASSQSLYLRFFSVGLSAMEHYLDVLIKPTSPDHRALLAVVQGKVAGVVSYERVDDRSADVSLLVADDRQHEGIGTLLLEHLASAARRQGIQAFVADVLNENAAMINVFRALGFAVDFRFDGGCLRVTIDLTATVHLMEALDERDRQADAASLQSVLAPSSIAVIGASNRQGAVGNQVLRNLTEFGFAGNVYAVNPCHETILGVQCFPSPEQLPEPVDLAVVAVPADQVLEVTRACGVRGVRGLLILTAGFGEIDESGSALQTSIVVQARRFGIRVIGPNCLGVLNTDPAVRLNATFARIPLLAGGLGLVSQSGALGIAVLSAAARSGLGVSAFVSVGNKADVSSNDLLLAWEKDSRTRVIALYLESFGNPGKFSRIARRVSRSKPIIAIKAGRSPAGKHAGMSHTAAAAASDEVVDALFRQAGVLRVTRIEEMIDAARMLCDQPLPAGNRVAIVGNSGGPGILAADAAEGAGLTVVQLTPDTTARLRSAAPMAASVDNPVDLSATVPAEAMQAALGVLMLAPEVDAVVVVFTETGVIDAAAMMAGVANAGGTSAKPVLATEVGSVARSLPIAGSDRRLPVFAFPENAVAALGAAVQYAGIRNESREVPVRPAGVYQAAAREIVKAAMHAGVQWLPAQDTARLLANYRIPPCDQRVVCDTEAAVAAARQLGYPLAATLAEPGLHKSELGGVRLNIVDEKGLRSTVAELRRRWPGTSVLLQPMLAGGTEVIIGALQHQQFGPLVMLGAGGVLTDLLLTKAFRLAPLSSADAAAMIEDAHLGRLIDGYRGAPVVSRPALVDLILRTAAMVGDLPELAELDFNPVLCRSEGLTVVDARIRLAASPVRPDSALRQLL
ncbi:MAG: GNAT family N-acetyltransferase [Actinomycetota bacterium]|nr:GNAT family N-acetyltransferase [Actinomycetota bacterium]